MRLLATAIWIIAVLAWAALFLTSCAQPPTSPGVRRTLQIELLRARQPFVIRHSSFVIP